MTQFARIVRFVMIAAALSLVSLADASAGSVKSYFLGFDSGTSAVRADILGTDARFDLLNSADNGGATTTPTLATLLAYDSVLVWTNAFPDDPVLLGDVLADYADAGGHVVLATFVGQEIHNYAGRIFQTGYSPLYDPDGNAYTAASLGTYDAGSPLFDGVSSITATTYRGDYFPGLDTGATLVAAWDDGKPFVAVNATGNVIDITLFPNVVTFGHATGDYQQLFRNALAYGVPQPGALVLLGLGAVALGFRRRK